MQDERNVLNRFTALFRRAGNDSASSLEARKSRHDLGCGGKKTYYGSLVLLVLLIVI